MKRLLSLVIAAAISFSGCALTGNVDGNEVVAYFEDAGDLVQGANVQMLDVEIGIINEIEYELRDGTMLAKVTLALDPKVDVPADGISAVIRQTSLLGEQFLELVPGTEGPPYIGAKGTTIDVADTDRRVDIETFLSDLSSFVGSGALEDLNRFTHAQALILEERGERLGNTIEELERFTSVLADRKLDIASAIDHLAGAGKTLAANTATLDSFLDSLEDANVLLADQGDELQLLFSSLRRFGTVSSRFLSEHEQAIDRQFRALRPVLQAIAGADGELRADIGQLATFLELFTKSLGGGPGGTGKGDYIQVQAVICEALANCNTNGEKGDVPGEGSGR
jgi:phospholipid/cholesterol/gamma-HCH transport system substrate-binding protein